MPFRRVLLLGALLGALVDVGAQERDADSISVVTLPETALTARSTEPSPLEEIVVTAQRRQQAQSDVPINLSVLGREQLDQFNIQQFDDLAAFVPGLEVQEQSANNPSFVIRGISTQEGEAFAESRVAVFQDGVPASRSRGSFFELFDLERVEVVKGPQSTLFGRAALTGGINVIQKKADYTGDAAVDIIYGWGDGNSRYTQISGHAGGAIVADRLAVRLAAIQKVRDPYIENSLGGRGFNGVDVGAYRLTLRLDPSEFMSIDLIANHQVDSPPGTGFKSNRFAPVNGDTSPYTAAALQNFGGFRDGRDLGLERDLDSISSLITWRLGERWTVDAVTGYRRFDAEEIFDADGSYHDLFTVAEVATGRQFSQELRIAFDDEHRLSGFFGAHYLAEQGEQFVPLATDIAVGLPFFAEFVASGNVREPTTPSSGQIYEEEFANQADNKALDLFADASFDLTDRWGLTAGLRWTQDRKISRYVGRSVTNLADPGRTLFIAASENGDWLSADARFSGLSWRTILSFEWSPLLKTWASYSRGRRPEVVAFDSPTGDESMGTGLPGAGLLPSTPADYNFVAPKIVPAEIVDSLEIGGHAAFFEGRARLNGSVFYYDYSNFQTRTFVPGEAAVEIRNAGAADAIGLEMEWNLQASQRLGLLFSYGYNRARFADSDGRGRELEYGGNRFRLSPDHSLSLGLNYALPLPLGPGHLDITPTYSYRSKVFFDDNNDRPDLQSSDDTQDEFQGGYGLLNLQLRYALAALPLELNAFARNLLDTEYLIDAGNTGDSFGSPTFIRGPSRLIGAGIAIRFD